MAGVCQNAYGPKAFKDESTCRSAKCNACMLFGDGFQDGMVTAEQVELEKDGHRRLFVAKTKWHIDFELIPSQIRRHTNMSANMPAICQQ